MADRWTPDGIGRCSDPDRDARWCEARCRYSETLTMADSKVCDACWEYANGTADTEVSADA